MTPPPLLLAAHGTTDQAGVDAFAALTERVGKLAGADGTRVAGGFIELSEPPLREAVTGLAGASPGPMVAVPLMLSAAGHAKGRSPRNSTLSWSTSSASTRRRLRRGRRCEREVWMSRPTETISASNNRSRSRHRLSGET